MKKTVLRAFNVNGEKRMLADILTAFPFDQSLNWSLIWFDGVVNFEGNASYDDFVEKINQSPYGVSYKTDELLVFSKNILDIRDLVLVGYHNFPVFDKRLVIDGFYEGVELVVELFDSTEWVIYA